MSKMPRPRRVRLLHFNDVECIHGAHEQHVDEVQYALYQTDNVVSEFFFVDRFIMIIMHDLFLDVYFILKKGIKLIVIVCLLDLFILVLLAHLHSDHNQLFLRY